MLHLSPSPRDAEHFYNVACFTVGVILVIVSQFTLKSIPTDAAVQQSQGHDEESKTQHLCAPLIMRRLKAT